MVVVVPRSLLGRLVGGRIDLVLAVVDDDAPVLMTGGAVAMLTALPNDPAG